MSVYFLAIEVLTIHASIAFCIISLKPALLFTYNCAPIKSFVIEL